MTVAVMVMMMVVMLMLTLFMFAVFVLVFWIRVGQVAGLFRSGSGIFRGGCGRSRLCGFGDFLFLRLVSGLRHCDNS